MVFDVFLRSSGWWGGLNKFFGPKTTFFEKMSKKVKVLDGGGGLNKFLGVKNDILKKYVPKCQSSGWWGRSQ